MTAAPSPGNLNPPTSSLALFPMVYQNTPPREFFNGITQLPVTPLDLRNQLPPPLRIPIQPPLNPSPLLPSRTQSKASSKILCAYRTAQASDLQAKLYTVARDTVFCFREFRDESTRVPVRRQDWVEKIKAQSRRLELVMSKMTTGVRTRIIMCWGPSAAVVTQDSS
jgi:hypothetical protein